jgi:hypothetical protein
VDTAQGFGKTVIGFVRRDAFPAEKTATAPATFRNIDNFRYVKYTLTLG